MSHLQKKLIAKAKGQLQNARKPQAMPRTMRVKVATNPQGYPFSKKKKKLGMRAVEDGPIWDAFWWCSGGPGYHIFTLKR